MRSRLALLALLALLAGTNAGAQDRINDLGSFRALVRTPAGALPSPVIVQMSQDSARRFAMDLRYGRFTLRNQDFFINNLGVAARVRVIRSLNVGAIVARRTCSVCDGLTMVGVEASATLLHHKAVQLGAGDSDLGLQFSAGIGNPDTLAFITQSVGISLPVTVTLPQSNNGLLVLSVLPGVAYGRLKDDGGVVFATTDSLGAAVPGPIGTFGATRLIIGASLAYLFPAGLGLHVTVHRIAIEESTTQAGAVVSWRF